MAARSLMSVCSSILPLTNRQKTSPALYLYMPVILMGFLAKGRPMRVVSMVLVRAFDTSNSPMKKLPAASGRRTRSPQSPVLHVVSLTPLPSYPSTATDGYSSGVALDFDKAKPALALAQYSISVSLIVFSYHL